MAASAWSTPTAPSQPAHLRWHAVRVRKPTTPERRPLARKRWRMAPTPAPSATWHSPAATTLRLSAPRHAPNWATQPRSVLQPVLKKPTALPLVPDHWGTQSTQLPSVPQRNQPERMLPHWDRRPSRSASTPPHWATRPRRLETTPRRRDAAHALRPTTLPRSAARHAPRPRSQRQWARLALRTPRAQRRSAEVQMRKASTLRHLGHRPRRPAVTLWLSARQLRPPMPTPPQSVQAHRPRATTSTSSARRQTPIPSQDWAARTARLHRAVHSWR